MGRRGQWDVTFMHGSKHTGWSGVWMDHWDVTCIMTDRSMGPKRRCCTGTNVDLGRLDKIRIRRVWTRDIEWTDFIESAFEQVEQIEQIGEIPTQFGRSAGFYGAGNLT